MYVYIYTCKDWAGRRHGEERRDGAKGVQHDPNRFRTGRHSIIITIIMIIMIMIMISVVLIILIEKRHANTNTNDNDDKTNVATGGRGGGGGGVRSKLRPCGGRPKQREREM